ncbi:MAG: hypothetical protein Q9184_001353 [Pyrenodesmia sp. 2 TL-2023]
MTSRRVVSDEKNLIEKDDGSDRRPAASDIAPAVPAAVIVKLLGFTAAMVGGPIGVYFLTVHTIFRGSSTWAGATAALTANLVLIAYVIVAMREDQSYKIAAEEQAKKRR